MLLSVESVKVRQLPLLIRGRDMKLRQKCFVTGRNSECRHVCVVMERNTEGEALTCCDGERRLCFVI